MSLEPGSKLCTEQVSVSFTWIHYSLCFLKTASLRHNSHTTLHPFREYNSVISTTVTELYQHHYYLTLEPFPHPPEKPCVHHQSLPLCLPPSPKSYSTHLFSLPLYIHTWLFWTFHVCRITQYMVICKKLLSLNVVYLFCKVSIWLILSYPSKTQVWDDHFWEIFP